MYDLLKINHFGCFTITLKFLCLFATFLHFFNDQQVQNKEVQYLLYQCISIFTCCFSGGSVLCIRNLTSLSVCFNSYFAFRLSLSQYRIVPLWKLTLELVLQERKIL